MKRHSAELKIALAAIVALVLLFFLFKFLRGLSLFTHQDTYYIRFDNAKAVAKSSPVYADGYNVGIISDITYTLDDPTQGVVLKISVEPGLRIPKGTYAVLDEGMLGGCTLNLLMSNDPMQRYEVGDTLPSRDNSGLLGGVAEVMPKLEAAIAHADSLLLTINRLAQDPHIVQILANVDDLTARLNTSSADLNKLLENDIPNIVATYNETGKNLNAITAKIDSLRFDSTMNAINGTLAQLQAVSEKLNRNDNTLGLLFNDTALYHNLNATTTSATLLLEDLKAHPKRYVHFSVFGKKDK